METMAVLAHRLDPDADLAQRPTPVRRVFRGRLKVSNVS